MIGRFIKKTKKYFNSMWVRETWWYKIYSFFRYDMWIFLTNIWKFRRELWMFRWWDYHYTLMMLHRSITIMEKGMHDGWEVPEMRYKKIEKMKRLLYLLDNKIKDTYIEKAESEIGSLESTEYEFIKADGGLTKLEFKENRKQSEHRKMVYKRAIEIENSEWNEMWDIVKGTDLSKFYGDDYDGTDIRGWWD
jgi:hypothetical protein